MNPFAGIVFWGDASAAPGLEQGLSAIVARRAGHRPQVRRTDHAVFIQAVADPLLDEDGTLFLADVFLDNRKDIAAGIADASASDAALVRAAILKIGDGAMASLLGAFAAAHWDERTRQLTFVRDCIGRRSLFYHRGNGFVVFASYLPDLLAVPNVPCDVDETMMAKFLAQDHNERERTLYRGIDRVASRTCVTMTQADVRIRHYWSPPFDVSPPFKRDEDYVERGRELFDRAVARCLRDTSRVAVLTSGGFDSSAVAATAVRLGCGDITCYTGLPPDERDLPASPMRYFDERPYVEALMRLYPSLRTRFLAPSGMHPLYRDCARLFALQALPAWGPVDRSWFYPIEDAIAADGHGVLLDGAVGNFGLSWTGQFSLAALARQGRFATGLSEARKIAKARNLPLGRILKEELLHRMAPRKLHRLAARLRGADPDEVGRSSLLHPGAIARLDLRRHWKQDRFDPRYHLFGDPVRLRAELLFDRLQITRDIRAMSGALRGNETRDPHADRELIAFCLAVPETLYRRNGVPRWFVRQVFADRLPPEILNERRRGVQSPNWFEVLTARKPLFEAEIADLESSPLVCRLIDIPHMKRLLSDWPEDRNQARTRAFEYRYALDRACHVGRFIRWVEMQGRSRQGS